MGIEVPAWLDAGAGSATCNLLTIGSATAAGIAVNSARSLQLWPALTAAGVSAAFAGAAHALNCTQNPGSPPGVGSDWTGSYHVGRGCYTNVWRVKPDGSKVLYTYHSINGFTATRQAGGQVSANWYDDSDHNGSYERYNTAYATLPEFTGFFLEPRSGTNCGAPVGPPGPGNAYDYKYTDPATSCQYTYKLQDSWIGSDGFPRFAWAIEGATTRAGSCQGGRITGYVWAPSTENRFMFNPDFDFGGGGPGGGWKFDPDWGGIVQAILKVMEYNDPGDHYRLTSVCELDTDGEPIDRAVDVVIPPGFRNQTAAMNARLAAIVQLLQGLKDFKQPICGGEVPSSYVGTNISLQFRSEHVSPEGKARLRKVFRYRDPSDKDLALHAAHWKGFEWTSGPVMVISEGLEWGRPQVWAASQAEGIRVLSHAAAICGVDVSSPAHRWVARETLNARYGQRLKMQLHKTWDGRDWVATRDGPNGLPFVS